MLGLVIVLLLVGGLAAKQISFILLYGSVFESTRSFIQRFSYTEKWLWVKLQELWTCHLCMTAQTSLWFVGLPITIGIHWRWPHPLEQVMNGQFYLVWEVVAALGAWFIISMANAAVAMGFWQALEYLPQKLESQKKIHDNQIRLLRLQLIRSSERDDQPMSISDYFPESDFRDLLTALRVCSGIGCSTRRGECRKDTTAEWVEQWVQQNLPDDPRGLILAEQLREKLSQTLHWHFSRGSQPEQSYRHLIA